MLTNVRRAYSIVYDILDAKLYHSFIHSFGFQLLRLIDEKEIRPNSQSKLAKAKDILRDEIDGRFDSFGLRMGDYHNFGELVGFMQKIQSAFPARTQLRTIGWTAEGRPIQGIQVRNN